MILDLFPTQIYTDHIQGTEQLLESNMQILRKYFEGGSEHPDMGIKSTTTYNLHQQLHTLPGFSDLTNQLNLIVNNLWKEWNYYDLITPFINEMWINETLPGGSSVVPHNHSPYPLAGALYLKATPESGSIVFENPNGLLRGTQPHNWSGPADTNGGILADIPIETGKLIVFPGWLRHFTRQNKSDENRYVLSFNIACTGEYPVSTYIKNVK